MFKLILMAVVGFIVYKAVKTLTTQKSDVKQKDESIEEELIECSRCGTFTPRNEISFDSNGRAVCKDCQ